MTLKGLIWMGYHWKLIVHVLFHTKRFGVNNQWTSQFVSLLSEHKGNLVENYKAAKFRATTCGFLTREECKSLGWKSEI